MKKCEICESKNLVPHKVREMMYGTEEVFEYLMCVDCQCLQIAEVPENIGEYYRNNYYSHAARKINNRISQYLSMKRNSYSMFRDSIIGLVVNLFKKNDLLKSLSNNINDRNLKILDVGCGNGKLLRELDGLGYEKLMGIDPYGKHEIVSAALEIKTCGLEEVANEWDIIMFNHSLEHMSNQKGSLEYAKKILSKNGKIIIRIPIVSSYAWRLYGENWCQIDAPRHFYLHSYKSLGVLAEKCGLKVVDVKCDSYEFQFWGSELYKSGASLYPEYAEAGKAISKRFGNKKLAEYKKLSKQLNDLLDGDQAIFTLQIE